MNSNVITFDYQSGQIRRDLVRETSSRKVEIYVPTNAESTTTPINRFGTLIAFGKSMFRSENAVNILQFR